MKKELFEEYAKLKIQEKEIKFRIDELNPIIKLDMLDIGVDKVPTNLGNFNMKKVKKWKYSDDVEKAKKYLDELKANEEASGAATFVEVEQLEFRENKNG